MGSEWNSIYPIYKINSNNFDFLERIMYQETFCFHNLLLFFFFFFAKAFSIPSLWYCLTRTQTRARISRAKWWRGWQLAAGDKRAGKVAFSTEATWQDHTAIFHSHSSAFAKAHSVFPKGSPSPKEAFQQTEHTRQFLKRVTHKKKKGPPSRCIVVVIVLL